MRFARIDIVIHGLKLVYALYFIGASSLSGKVSPGISLAGLSGLVLIYLAGSTFLAFKLGRYSLLRFAAALGDLVFVLGLFYLGGGDGGYGNPLIFTSLVLAAAHLHLPQTVILLVTASASRWLIAYLYSPAPAPLSPDPYRVVLECIGMAAIVIFTRIFIGMVENQQRQKEELSRILRELRHAHVRLQEYAASARQMAVRDELTGLYNYRFFFDFLQQVLEREGPKREPVSLLMGDLDHFKKYNDCHGHHAGNQVLRKVSQVFLDITRACDVVCRYGGEEFAVLLLGNQKTTALAVAERIRREVERLGFEYVTSDGTAGTVTISAGIAAFPEDARTPEDMIRYADAALYRAKQGGRNLVCT
ncbi:MAG: GGDEF domain-containing protein [Firmicutes bacterium]|nr:GGDEF domain-containing protein [Bacillota bacterium]